MIYHVNRLSIKSVHVVQSTEAVVVRVGVESVNVRFSRHSRCQSLFHNSMCRVNECKLI